MRSRLLLMLLSTFACFAAPTHAQQANRPLAPVTKLAPDFTANNAVWLGHAFVSTGSVVQTVPRVADFLQDHRVSTWFVNMGLLDSQGKFKASVIPQAVGFLNAVANWEKASGKKVTVYAWLNGTTDAASPRVIDLSKPEVRSTIVSESLRFLDTTSADSFITEAARSFDGIQYDLEPSGEESKAADLGALLDELKARIPQGKLTSFTAHKYGENKGRYWWSPNLFYQLSPKVDLMCVMSYDTGLTDEAEFRRWMAGQVSGTLHAVSGAYWKNDALHPRPTKTAQILLGFPGFPANKYHELKAETMSAAALGTHDGLMAMNAAKDPDLTYFGGAAVYLYTDGTGTDSYSSPADWQAFKQHWLKSP